MPRRATKRGDERTPLDGTYDVLICGASFAGLTVARELAGSGAEVLIVDRYEIGERQTSACGIPTEWLRNMGLLGAERQRFDSLLVHSPNGTKRWPLPWTFSTFDYRELCELLWRDCDARFETAKVNGRAATPAGDGRIAIDTDRGVLSAPLVVDALGWRRILASGDGYQPPDAPLSRGLEVHPNGTSQDMELWIDRRYVPAGYGWSFPAGEELRIGVGSFDPSFHVRETTELLAEDLEQERVRYQGNWIPHKLRRVTEGGVFFVGDSAGHCLPLTAEGIRTALYFGIALGRELRGVVEGRQGREAAAAAYSEFSDSYEWVFNLLLRFQRMVRWTPSRLRDVLVRIFASRRLLSWGFRQYLRIAPPEFAATSANDQQRPGKQQGDAEQALGRERDLVEAE